MKLTVVPVTDAKGAVTDEALLRSAERVHRQLRPNLPPGYHARIREVLGSGAEMDVVEQGVARERACDLFTLDSGTQRQQAHKFYFRERMTMTEFHFSKKPGGAK